MPEDIAEATMTPLIALCLALSSAQDSAEKVYEAALPSILTLNIERSNGEAAIGTGFLAMRSGLVVTAWHLLKGARTVTAKFSDGTEARFVGLIDKDPELDIALIQVESGDRPCLSLADSDPKVGSRAFVIGSPRGLEFSISDGIISQTPFFGDSRLYQFTCPVSPGNSGGPLMSSNGRVLGVVSWQLKDAQNLNFAIPFAMLSSLDASKAPVELAHLAPSVMDGVITSVDDSMIEQVLAQAELQSRTTDDGTGMTQFLIDIGGTNASLFQYGSQARPGPAINLALSVGYKTTVKHDLAQLNEFNRSHRFARCYLDKSGVLFLENDLDLERGVYVRNLARFLAEYRSTLGQFESMVLKKPKATPVSSEVPDQDAPVFTDKALTEILKTTGKEVRSSDDGSGKACFTLVSQGLEINLYQYTDGVATEVTTSLTISLGLDLETSPGLVLVNTFNERSRYCKVFLDESGDPYLVSDLDLVGGVTSETVQAFVERFLKAVPGFVDVFSQP